MTSSSSTSPLFEETLRRLYYQPDEPSAYGSLTDIYTAAKNIHSSITKSFVERWLLRQNAYTLHAPLRKRFPRRKTIAPGLYYQLQLDLADLSNIKHHNKGYRFLLVAIDIFSRKAFVVPLKSKRGIEVRDGIAQIFTNYPPPKFIQVDSGTEFYNTHVRTYLRKWNIRMFSTSSDVKASLVERLNRTLKSRMFKYFTANNTIKYVDILQKLVNAYNNRKHSTIGMSPNQVSLANQSAVWDKQYSSYITGSRRSRFAYDLEQTVRISKLARTFRKGYLPTFQEEIFIIHDRLATVPPTYKVRDKDGNILIGSFYTQELQPVLL